VTPPRLSGLRDAVRQARWWLQPWLRPIVSFAQEGEDLVLERLLESLEVRGPGFYVDVGAHHPCRFSNTFRFYRRRWRGINVDATPGAMRWFRRIRPRDVNLELAVAEHDGQRTLFVFDDPALNTMDGGLVADRVAAGYRLVSQVSVSARRLASILEDHLPPGVAITFLSVDVEGLDLEVLRSNDWTRYAPLFVLTECLEADLEALSVIPTVRFLAGVGYRPVAKTMNTLFFQRVDGPSPQGSGAGLG
jgi:FkbM family methyltransferase